MPISKILHVEDDPDIREITLYVLENIGGFECLQCSSGMDAVQIAPEYLPDLFLLDVMMPGLNGPDTLKELRNNQVLSGIPAIFMTAKAHPSEVLSLMELGALGVITKPFDPMTLVEQINSIWALNT